MGGCHSVTLKEVTDKLESELLSSAKTILKSDFNKTLDPNHATLQDALAALSKANFKNKFTYDWDEVNVSPPNIDPDNKQSKVAWDYCIIASDDNTTITKAIAKYVKEGLAATHLVSWMKDKATADLTDIVGKLIVQPKDSSWHYSPATTQYNAANTDEDSWKLDLSLVYANATKTISCVEATLHIFYFVGAYYTIKSPAKETFGQLRGRAWSAASQLAGGASVKSDAELSNALSQWSKSANGPFQGDFGRSWDSKPKDFVQGNSNPIWSTNNYLAFFNTDKPDDGYLDRYVESNIMSGFNLPDGMKAWLKAMIVTKYKGILGQTKTTGWRNVKLSDTFGWGQTGSAAVSVNAEIIYWADNLTIDSDDQKVPVVIHYMYILGLVYELDGSPIVKDMRVGLMKHIPGVQSVPADPQPKDIKDAVFTYNNSLYKAAYNDNINWDQKNSPTEKSKKHWGDIFEFDNWSPSADNIKQQVTSRIFPRDYDGSIKNNLQPTVYDWIVKAVADNCTPNFAPDANSWYNITNGRGFTYTFTSSTGVKSDCILNIQASFAFCKAHITEGVHTGGTTLEHYFICVFIAVVASLDNDDNPLDV